MLNFSTKGEYGLRLAVNLAKHYPKIKSLKDVSVEENISLKYLEKLTSQLRKNNIVRSFRGKNGGYVLIKKPQEFLVGEIIEIMEGKLIAKCQKASCIDRENCASSFVWIKLEEQIRKTLYAIKLSDLIKS